MAFVHYHQRPVLDIDAEIRAFQNEINQLFRHTNPLDAQSFVPRAELSQTDDAVQIKWELPGLSKEEIEIEVTTDSVRVRGERKLDADATNDESRRSEFRYGNFDRTIGLPVEVNQGETTADYQNGILTLTLPKRVDEGSKVHRVEL
jgi:HSP20 family protein